MYNDSGEGSSWDPEECRREAVKGDNDDDRTEETTRGRPNTRFRLEGRSREGAGGWVSPKERANGVRNANRDQFLVRIDFVIVDSSER